MKAYKCDICHRYAAESPAGVLYDNREGHRNENNIGKGERYDLCPECVAKALDILKVDEPAKVPLITPSSACA